MTPDADDVRAKFANVEGSMSEELMAERRAEAARDAEYALEAEAKFTPGLRVREVLAHGDEIAEGLKKRCHETVARQHKGSSVVVLSPGDVLFLIDAYREARALIDGSSGA